MTAKDHQGELTNPGAHAEEVRRKRISSRQQLDTAAILLADLENAEDQNAAKEAIKKALHRAMEQGRLLERTDKSKVEEILAEERALRTRRETELSDAYAAYIQWERTEDPESLARLREILTLSRRE